MAINYELLNKGGISLGTNFELLSEKPLDSRLVVPTLSGLQNYIDNAAAYEGMIVYDQETKKTYQVQTIDGVLSYREFGINESELKDLIASETTAAMEFKGATATLPENPSKGDMWKVTASFEVAGETTKTGDSIVYNGEQWFLIPSGDDIEDTWRPVTGVDNDSDLTFAAGDKLDVAVAADGTITYSHETIAAPTDITAEGDERTRTYITAVETDGYGHITGFKTATENVEDTNTEYTFESQVESSSVYFNVTSSEEGADEQTIYVDAYSKNETNTELDKKLDKTTYEAYIAGKSMSDEELKEYANELDSAMNTRVEALEATDHTHTFADTDVDDAISKKHSHTFDDADVVDTIAKAHEHTFVETELNKIADGDVEKWNAAEQNAKDYVDQEIESAENRAANLYAVKSELLDGTIKVQDAKFADQASVADVAGTANTAGKVAYSFKIVSDAATIVEYDGSVEKSFDVSGFADKSETETALAGKVDVVAGHSLVADDEIARLADVDNYDDAEVRGLIGDNAQAIEDLENYVGTIPSNYTETNVVAYINKKAEETLAAAQGGSSETVASVKQQLDNYKSENDTRVENAEKAIDAIEADYLKAADIANFETKENVKKVSDDLAAYKTSNDSALAGVKATAEAATTVDEVNAQIDTKISALNLDITYEPIGAEDRAKAYVDGKFTDANLSQYTTEDEVKSIVDSVIADAADSETYNSLTKLVDYIDAHGGEASEMAQAIETLEGDVNGLKEAPSASIKTTDIEAWNGEVGAKALADTKLDASTFTEYSNAHASDYTNKQVDDAIDADVKTAIDAEILRANAAYDASGAAAAAQSAAEAKAAELDTALHTVISKEIDDDVKAAIDSEVARANDAYDAKGAAANAQEAAIADAATKYETIGTAQGIVDGLKLDETYEPIGAESRAIAAAKTETENQVKALAGDGNTSTVKKNADDIASLLEQLQWGSF